MDRTSVVVEDGSDLNFEETAAGIDLPGIRRSTHVRVPTERGLDYQLPLRKKNYNQCKKKLEDKLRDPRSLCCYYQANMPMMWLVKQITGKQWS